MSKKVIAANIKLKRAYERNVAADGTRILIDRLWPREVRKTDAAIDHWAKEIAPSTALRKWFGHDPSAGRNFAAAMRWSSTSILNSSSSYADHARVRGS